MLGHRQQRWPNIITALNTRFVLFYKYYPTQTTRDIETMLVQCWLNDFASCLWDA